MRYSGILIAVHGGRRVKGERCPACPKEGRRSPPPARTAYEAERELMRISCHGAPDGAKMPSSVQRSCKPRPRRKEVPRDGGEGRPAAGAAFRPPPIPGGSGGSWSCGWASPIRTPVLRDRLGKKRKRDLGPREARRLCTRRARQAPQAARLRPPAEGTAAAAAGGRDPAGVGGAPALSPARWAGAPPFERRAPPFERRASSVAHASLRATRASLRATRASLRANPRLPQSDAHLPSEQRGPPSSNPHLPLRDARASLKATPRLPSERRAPPSEGRAPPSEQPTPPSEQPTPPSEQPASL